MAFVNYNNKEITVKIVYYGPALSGKTTCLRYIYDSGEYRKKGKLITLDTDGDRTLFFDFLPIEIGKLGDYSIKIQLYTVPGQVAYNTTRKLVLQGADGIVFVADSQSVMKDQNINSFTNLKENLKANNISYNETPLIFQYNKRDLKEILPVDILNKDLNPESKPYFPTVGTTGENILEGLHTVMKVVLIHLKNKLKIFQKDKTVMFSRDEITDSINKKSKKKSQPDPPPFPDEDMGVEDSEKDDIFELSGSMTDELLQTQAFPNRKPVPEPEPEEDEPELLLQDESEEGGEEEEEDIFNLGDSGPFGEEGEGEAEDAKGAAPEGIGDDEKISKAHESTQVEDMENIDNLGDLAPAEPEEESGVQHISAEYEVQPEGQPVGQGSVPTTTVPITIEIPQDKDEIKINLNLQIVIKKKP